MSKNMHLWGHLQNFKSQCERESTRMALYSNYFTKVYHSNELKISRTKHIHSIRTKT